MINNAIDIGHFPMPWKTAKVLAISKKASTNAVDEFGPIALLCSMGKVYIEGNDGHT